MERADRKWDPLGAWKAPAAIATLIILALSAGGVIMILGLTALRYLHRRPGGLGIPAFWLAPCVTLIQAGVLFIPPADDSDR